MAIVIGRRKFVAALGGAAVGWPLAAWAKQPARLPTVGLLTPDTSGWSAETAAFVERLSQLGWIEGRTITIEYRWSEGRPERVAEIAAEFVRQKVDVIVAYGGAVAALKQATTVIPHRLCNRGRSGRQRLCREPGAPGRQRHWNVAPEHRYDRQAARTLA
jgi:putative tryptophan/tyrosine transport system substrate-binding protein